MMEEDPAYRFLRVYIEGGGCSGMKYGFDLVQDETEFDLRSETNGVCVLVDAIAAPYLNHCTIDYQDDFEGSKFTIDNPNAATTCGCGESFFY
jgi:iron-sulfur cluster insertion protein